MLISTATLNSLNPKALILVLWALAGGCTVSPIYLNGAGKHSPQYADCLSLFQDNEEIIKQAKVRDVQATQVHGFPFLRTNRFLTSLRDRLNTPAEQETWLERLAQLDLEGRRIEINNLPPDKRPLARTIDAIERCRNVLVDEALSSPAIFARIRGQAAVPDSYNLWARTVGLYPFTALFVLRGVERLHTGEGRYFNGKYPDDPDLGVSAKRVVYGPAANTTGRDYDNVIERASRDALGVPFIDQDKLNALFARHSPIWSVANRSPDDRIGSVAYDAERIVIVTETPSVYTHLGYTKFDEDILVQLNYTIWFPARPQASAFDILSGSIDGITWRVTLDTTGNVLLADAMHNCGCYYMAFPTRALQARDRKVSFEEPLWIPQTLSVKERTRAVIHIAEMTHYIRKVEFVDEPATNFELTPIAYDTLRSLSTTRERFHSMFDTNGLIKGSERAERWLLWPMGVASAGAMRQVGHHPIAFVGRRHFDDPDLLDVYFERTEP